MKKEDAGGEPRRSEDGRGTSSARWEKRSIALATLPPGFAAVRGELNSLVKVGELGKGDARSLFLTTCDGCVIVGGLTAGIGMT